MQEEVINLQGQSFCGIGQWYLIAYLNMKDPTEQCPPAWREYNENRVRACGGHFPHREVVRPQITLATMSIARCVEGLSDTKLLALMLLLSLVITISLIDGVNITSGEGREHIWSFIAGISAVFYPGPLWGELSPPKFLFSSPKICTVYYICIT